MLTNRSAESVILTKHITRATVSDLIDVSVCLFCFYLLPGIMATHAAIQMVAQRQPLQLAQVPTVEPGDGETLVKVEWVCSTPLDLHQADGGLGTTYPNIVGDSIAGKIMKLGPNVENLKVGDKVRTLSNSWSSSDLSLTGVWLWLAITKGESSTRVCHLSSEPARQGISCSSSCSLFWIPKNRFPVASAIKKQ